jgi:hypothetical protein
MSNIKCVYKFRQLGVCSVLWQEKGRWVCVEVGPYCGGAVWKICFKYVTERRCQLIEIWLNDQPGDKN